MQTQINTVAINPNEAQVIAYALRKLTIADMEVMRESPFPYGYHPNTPGTFGNAMTEFAFTTSTIENLIQGFDAIVTANKPDGKSK